MADDIITRAMKLMISPIIFFQYGQHAVFGLLVRNAFDWRSV